MSFFDVISCACVFVGIFGTYNSFSNYNRIKKTVIDKTKFCEAERTSIKVKLGKLKVFYISSFLLYILITVVSLYFNMDCYGKETKNIIFTSYWMSFLLFDLPNLSGEYSYSKKKFYTQRRIQFNAGVLLTVFIATMVLMIIRLIL